jgi:tetratricopeptide (TPR) repeat protein
VTTYLAMGGDLVLHDADRLPAGRLAHHMQTGSVGGYIVQGDPEEVVALAASLRTRRATLDMALALLDSRLSEGVRSAALGELERLLEDGGSSSFLRNTLHARPLAAPYELASSNALAKHQSAPTTARLLRELGAHQDAIMRVRVAWDRYAASREDRPLEYELALTDLGFFRQAALDFDKEAAPEAAIFLVLVDRELSKSWLAQDLLESWATYLGVTRSSPHRPRESRVKLKRTSPRSRPLRVRSLDSESLRRQSDAIRAAIVNRDTRRFNRYLQDLASAEPADAAVQDSLVRVLNGLATFAKDRTDFALQLRLTETATQVSPRSSWAWAQHADALLRARRLDDAIEAARHSEDFGGGDFAIGLQCLINAQQGTFDVAERDLARLTGTSEVARIFRARTLQAMKKFDEAILAFDEVIEETPWDAISLAQRAECHRALNNFEAALDDYSRAVDLGNSTYARTGLASTWMAVGDFSQALTLFDALLEDTPWDAIVASGRAEALKGLGRLDEALVAYDEIVDARGDEYLQTAPGRANLLLLLNRPSDALRAYRKIRARYPLDLMSASGEAEVLKALGHTTEALAIYDEARESAPTSLVIANARANTLLQLNQPAAAIAAYEETLSRVPWDVVAANGRAEALRALGRTEEALTAYRDVCERNPNNAYSRNGYANMLLVSHRGDEALVLYDEALQKWPWNPVSASGRGETLRALGRLEESLAALEEALQRHPHRMHLRNGRALTLLALGRREDALAAFDEVLAEAPWDPHAARGRADALRTLRRVDESIELLDKLVASHPFDVQSRHDRATALKSARRYEAAAAEYTSMIEEFPYDDLAPVRLAGLRLVQRPGIPVGETLTASASTFIDGGWTGLIVRTIERAHRTGSHEVDVVLSSVPSDEDRTLLRLVAAVSEFNEASVAPDFEAISRWPTRTCDVTEALRMHVDWRAAHHDDELATRFASALGLEVKDLTEARIADAELELLVLAA